MSTDLVRVDLSTLPAHALQHRIQALEADLTRAAGSLVGGALRRIVSAYPVPKDFADPQQFVDQAIVALEDFPAFIIEELADPKVGIVREARFLPRIAELVNWCETRINRYRLACDEARQVIAHRERQATIRQLEREAAEAAREEEAREESAKQIEPEILQRLRQLPIWTPERQPRVGEERARNSWQAAMAARLSRWPNLVEPYLGILNEQPELLIWATEQENTYRGSGWPRLSHLLFDLFETRRAGAASVNAPQL